MYKKTSFLLLIIFVLSFGISKSVFAQAQHPVEVYFFYSDSCPHCHEMKLFLAKLIQNNQSIKVNSYEVSTNQDNQALMISLARAYGKEAEGVPILFIGDKIIEGDYQGEVENAINNCAAMGCESPLKKVEQNTGNTQAPQANFIMQLRWVIIAFALIFLGIIILKFHKKES